MEKVQAWLEKTLIPISTKLSSSKFMQALSGGMMSVLPIMMIGAIFSILTNLPIDAYKTFIADIGLAKFYTLGTTMTTDLISIYMTYFIAKKLFLVENIKDQSSTIWYVGSGMFLHIITIWCK